MKFQNAPIKNQYSLIKLDFVVFWSLAFFVLCGSFNLSGSVFAQSTEIEKQLNKPVHPKNVKTRPAEKPRVETVRAKPKPKTNAVTKGGAIKPTGNKPEERQQVTFRTGAATVEIWSDGKQLGLSDNAGKFITSLAGGEHLITARKYNQDLFASTKISVSSDVNSFDFSADVAKGLDEVRQAQIDEEKNKPAEPPPVDSDTILRKYRDPESQNSITLKDWQAVYDQCHQQAAIGNTDNKIEAICSFAQGQVELSLGNRQKAVSLFSAAVLFLPNSPILHYGLGVAQLSAGNTVDATTSFTKTIQLDNKFSLAYKELGKIYQGQDRTREAASYYQQAQSLGDNTPDLRLKIAETQIKNKNCPAAVKELEVLQTQSPNAGVLTALSDCYVEQKRFVSAIEVLGKAIQLDPTSAVAQYRIGVLYLKQKEFVKAKESLEQALKLDGEGKTVNRKEIQGLIGKAQRRATNE